MDGAIYFIIKSPIPTRRKSDLKVDLIEHKMQVISSGFIRTFPRYVSHAKYQEHLPGFVNLGLNQLTILIKKDRCIVVFGDDQPDVLSGFYEIVEYNV